MYANGGGVSYWKGNILAWFLPCNTIDEAQYFASLLLHINSNEQLLSNECDLSLKPIYGVIIYDQMLTKKEKELLSSIERAQRMLNKVIREKMKEPTDNFHKWGRLFYTL